MSLSSSDNIRFEQLIAEAFAAEKAGVFAQTPVDVAALNSGSLASTAAPQPARRIRFHERILVGLPVAACIAAVIGMASLWSLDSGNNAMTNPLASLRPVSAQADAFSARAVVDCMSGPGATVSDQCSAADFDNDGDVDLLDLSAYQREAAGLNR
ncbi:MAG: hypothetical protein H6817_03035 [Phycisphaerales bacterium]|nr:hypothetical protein [Phycisphaerales bacterium]